MPRQDDVYLVIGMIIEAWEFDTARLNPCNEQAVQQMMQQRGVIFDDEGPYHRGGMLHCHQRADASWMVQQTLYKKKNKA